MSKTLLDEFAIAIMEGSCANPALVELTLRAQVEGAYKGAAAMMEERQKYPPFTDKKD